MRPSRFHISRGYAAFLAVATLLSLLVLTSAAKASVSTSNIASVYLTGQPPSLTTAFLANSATDGSQSITIAGTTDGTTGDNVDINCYQGGVLSWNIASGVAVNSDGSFSTQVPMSNVPPGTCQLAAVPAGSSANLTASEVGPTITFSGWQLFPTGSNPWFFSLDDATLQANTTIAPSELCGASTALVNATAQPSNALFGCAADLNSSTANMAAGADLTSSELQVDGQTAYTAFGAADQVSNAQNETGFPQATVTLNSFDPATGDAQLTDSEPLVFCAPSNVFNPTAGDCTSFTSAGVELDRTVTVSAGGKVQAVSDTFKSTDGTAHTITADYEDDVYSPSAGFKLPGQTDYTQHATGDTAAGPGESSGTGTVYVSANQSDDASLTNEVGVATYSTPYDSVRFDNTLINGSNSALFNYQRTVPASGTTTIAWTYGTASNNAEQQADALKAQDVYQAPVVNITTPAANASAPAGPTTVSGVASAGSGVASVSVNGQAATLGVGGTWTVQVPLSAGANTLTATVTSDSGATAQASENVTGTVASSGGGTGIGSPEPAAHQAVRWLVGHPSLKVVRHALRLRPGATLVCGVGPASCHARVTVQVAVKAHHRTRWVVLAVKRMMTPAGTRRPVTIYLSRAATARAEHLRVLRVKLSLWAKVGSSKPVRDIHRFSVKVPKLMPGHHRKK